MIQSAKILLRSGRRRIAARPFSVAFIAAVSLAVACGGDDDDDVAALEATGGDDSGGGTSGQGGSSARGGTSTGGRGGTGQTGGTSMGGEGGEDATGGTGGASGSGGKATIVPPDTYDGQEVFRFDTFGDEQFWTGTLRMHEAIQAALHPLMALELGLKVDAEVLPEGILEEVDLEDPATTVALIGMNAVVGVQGTVEDGVLTSVGITCALCHSDVDDSVMDGIGVRIDGAANRDLDPGAIIALAPGLEGNDEAIEAYSSWGPGFYDPRFNQDMISDPVLIPPIYGLADVPLETYTGDGPISYWNAYVGITQMGGIGNFFDPRIGVSVAYDQDLINPKLPALYEYQVSLEAPEPEAGSFDAAAAGRGEALFMGAARCSTCHSGPAFSDADTRLHEPAETGMDAAYAERSATKKYRTTPLRALALHAPYFHNGSAMTLEAVVTHYNAALGLSLTAPQQADLVEYLKSL